MAFDIKFFEHPFNIGDVPRPAVSKVFTVVSVGRSPMLRFLLNSKCLPRKPEFGQVIPKILSLVPSGVGFL